MYKMADDLSLNLAKNVTDEVSENVARCQAAYRHGAVIGAVGAVALIAGIHFYLKWFSEVNPDSRSTERKPPSPVADSKKPKRKPSKSSC